MNLTIEEREFHTVVAALRYWQTKLPGNVGTPDTMELLSDIVTGDGTVRPLDTREIDALCERISHKARLEILEVCPVCRCADIQGQFWVRINTDPPEVLDDTDRYRWCDGCEERGMDGEFGHTLDLSADDPTLWHIPVDDRGKRVRYADWPDELKQKIKANEMAE